ncbi:MAG TPA: DEAD/DEAH box helicase, partial [Verrucomicrobiae bacterium]
REVKLRPRVVAEVRVPWAGSETEYCYVDILGASADGRHVERWNGFHWSHAHDYSAEADEAGGGLERLDRAALAPLPMAIAASAFKHDPHFQCWSLRVTKKFPEAFVPFLKSLPPETVIELRGELASFQNAQVAGKIRLEASEAGMDWFDLRVLVDVNDATLTPEEIKLLLDAKGKWVRLGTKGWRRLEFALSEEEDKELARLGLTPHELTSEPQRLHAFQLADKAARKFLPEETCERIERRATELQARVTPDVPLTITAELRPYQRDGFHFLAYLSTNNFGGILADDMGLGKTLQTLTWLAWMRGGAAPAQNVDVTPASRETQSPQVAGDGMSPEPSVTRASHPPSLVVCPKSVMDNWHAEAARFFPTLAVRVWRANELKSLAGQLASADLHVLNYSQLRQVADDLARADFHAVILDEGQYIKNPSSQTAQVARRLRATHRLILSGTPIENRLLDLWSLMSFAMPGALGNRAEFARLYDSKSDPFARQRLSARVRPFLIRRTKSQVARDLPDRVEEDLFCELEGEQKTLYRAELKRAQAMLLGIKTAAALNKERFNFLTSLLRLRQICCHPKLVKPDSKAASAKVEALVETLEPLMDEGEKVLVFSQFVELLDLLRGAIEERGWRQWYLAGDTENRGDLVSEFQSADGAGVFLISLKAGGFGLNLTAASYVVLFDPWWNPAVEAQAIDRTHRIGQDRKVIAYRLLIKDSIEEKIRTLQKQKKALAEDVLGEEKFAQGLSLDDLRYLLAE